MGRALIVLLLLLSTACREDRGSMFEVSRVHMERVPPGCAADDHVQCPAPPMPPLETLPKVIHRVEPVRTETARRAGITGTVILRIGIRRDGSVGGICVLKPLPCGLNTAAIEAVRQWKFEPREAVGIANVHLHFRTESTAR